MTSFSYSDTFHALCYAAEDHSKKGEDWASVPVKLLLEAAAEIKKLQALNASLERQKLDLLVERAMPWPAPTTNP